MGATGMGICHCYFNVKYHQTGVLSCMHVDVYYETLTIESYSYVFSSVVEMMLVIFDELCCVCCKVEHRY